MEFVAVTLLLLCLGFLFAVVVVGYLVKCLV